MVMIREQESRVRFLPASEGIERMRHNGYKTTYAIAELIDNSVDAGAKNIELLCYDRVDIHSKPKVRTIHQIAVADDGSGMNVNELINAIAFTKGSRLDAKSGIGKYGMGLPNSTVSQCRRLDVYTWQNGNATPIHLKFTIDEVKMGKMEMVPQPDQEKIDDHWKKFSKCLSAPSGTLVVWSELDRCKWKKAKTIIKNSETTIGRIYRKQLKNHINIVAKAFDEFSNKPEIELEMRPNDPMFLMENTSTPEPYDKEAMFEEVEPKEKIKCTGDDGKKYEVEIRFSVAKKKTREKFAGSQPGSQRWGKRARDNSGISLMRENRELDLDTSMVKTYETRERWWGVEVTFPPPLDDLFGVTFTKQGAPEFTELAKEIARERDNNDEDDEYGDDKSELRRVIEIIYERLGPIRKRIEQDRIGALQSQSKKRYAEKDATEAAKKRQNEGDDREGDAYANADPKARKDAVIENLTEDGIVGEKEAIEIAKQINDDELRFKIVSGHLEGYTLFEVSPVMGVLIIKLNSDHRAYRNLIDVLQGVPHKGGDIEEFRRRLQRGNNGLRLLLCSWAQLEHERKGEAKKRTQALRIKWGEILEQFLASNTEE